tara:strand:- start:647 stop:2827 length:2181 start_codon:yes stop_codon:yes gene_type:complete
MGKYSDSILGGNNTIPIKKNKYSDSILGSQEAEIDEIDAIIKNPSTESPGPSMRVASPSMYQGITDAVQRGFTGGLADPVKALGSATAETVGNYVTGEEGPTFGEAYDQSLGNIRADERAFARENPYVGGTAEVGAMFANPAMNAAGRYVAGGKNISTRMLRGALTGAPIGGVYGGSTAEPNEQLYGTMTGSLMGLGAGLLSVPLIEGAIGLTRGALQIGANRLGGDVSRSGQQIGEIIKQIGNGDVQAGLAIVRTRLKDFGEDAVIADILGPQGVNKASGASLVPGRASEVSDAFVAARQKGRSTRLKNAADEIASPDFHPKLESITSGMKKEAAPLYKEAFAPRSDLSGKVFVPWDDRLQQLLNDPLIREGMAKGLRTQQIEDLAAGTQINFKEYAVKGFDKDGNVIIDGTPNLRAMDAAKRGLDDIINSAKDDFGKINWTDRLTAINELRKALVAKLDDITTVNGRSPYAEARKAYAGPASAKDAMFQGRRFQKGDEEVSKAAFDKLSPNNQELFLLGVRREITKIINKNTQTAVNKFADKNEDLWIRLENVIPKEKFTKFKSEINKEIKKTENERIINPNAGSPSMRNALNVQDLSRAPNAAIEIAEGAKQGGPSGVVGALFKRGTNYLKLPSPKNANDMVDKLLEMNPAKQTEILDKIGERVLIENYLPLLSSNNAKRLSSLLTTKAPSMVQSLTRDMTEKKGSTGTNMEPTPMQKALGAR